MATNTSLPQWSREARLHANPAIASLFDGTHNDIDAATVRLRCPGQPSMADVVVVTDCRGIRGGIRFLRAIFYEFEAPTDDEGLRTKLRRRLKTVPTRRPLANFHTEDREAFFTNPIFAPPMNLRERHSGKRKKNGTKGTYARRSDVSLGVRTR